MISSIRSRRTSILASVKGWVALAGVLLFGCVSWASVQEPTPPNLDRLRQLDWRALLENEQVRRFVASLVYRVLPDDLRTRVDEDEIDRTLRIVSEEIATMPAGLTAKEQALYIAEKTNQRLFGDRAKTLDEQVQSALESLPDFVREKDGVYVVTLDRAGSLRILYQQNRYRGLSTIFTPRDPVEKGAILLQGENITFRLDGSHLDAKGDVALRDRRSFLVARELRYDAREQALLASGLGLSLPSLKFDAGAIEDTPQKLAVDGAELRASIIGIPAVRAQAKRLTIEGMEGNAQNVRVSLLGIPVYSRESVDFRLDSTGARDPNKLSFLQRLRKFADLAHLLKPPSVDFFSRNPAVSYQNSYMFGNRQLVEFGFRAQRDQLFNSGGQFSWNLSAADTSDPSVLNTGYVTEDYVGGYVQNADVRTMSDFVDEYRRPRRTAAIGYHANDRVDLLGEQDIHSVPIYFGLEVGGPIGSFGAIAQIRYEQAKSRALGAYEQRGTLFGSLGLFHLPFARGLELNGRIDGAGYKPFDREGYAWIRPVVALQARLLPQVYVSGAYVNGREFGTPFSIAETYLAGPEYHARLDLNFGPTQITYTNRYSVRRRNWYRSQFYIAQDIDAFQLYVLTDEKLSRLSFGLHLRIEEILDNLKSRRYTGVALDPPSVRR